MLSITLFVDDDATSTSPDGLAWESAYNDLQTALTRAAALNADSIPFNNVDRIWIAEGTYTPSVELEPGNARSASFRLLDGVALYGGFDGTETSLDARNFSVNITTISGDIGVLGNMSDNAYTVVYCGENITAAIDGVSINGGNADTYDSNHLDRNNGGGIYNYQGNLTLTNVTISGNLAGNSGGGIFTDSGTLTLINSTLSDNMAKFGGAIYSSGNLTLTNSTLSGNSVRYHGGGVYSDQGNLTLTNSTLLDNSTNVYGGGIYNDQGNLTLTNSMFSGNSAGTKGGGIYNTGSASVVLLNNTIVAGNVASNFGPDIHLNSGTLTGSYNLIGDGSDQPLQDGNNGNQVGTFSSPIDPMLSDWTQLDNGQWGYYLLPGSPAIDAGSNALAIDTFGQALTEDIYGNTRIINTVVDIGAVEGAVQSTPSQTYLVTSLDDTIADDGVLTFIEAFRAANANQPFGDAPAGSYDELDTIQFASTLTGTILVDDGQLILYGDLSIEGPEAGGITFDATGQSRVFYIQSGVSASFSGITITGGAVDYNGGGVYNLGNLTLINSAIMGNSSSGRYGAGGGIYNLGFLFLSNSTLADNSSNGYDGAGGGIYNLGNLTIASSTFLNNSSNNFYNEGGGVYNAGYLTLAKSILSGNSANTGGGIYNTGYLTLTNSILSGNTARSGGGVYHSQGNLTLNNSTLSGNSASSNGGGIYQSGRSTTATLSNNTIVAGNVASSGPDFYLYAGTLSGSYNLIGNGLGQTLVNNVDGNLVGTLAFPIDPCFVLKPSDGGDGWGDDSDTPEIDESANDDYGDLRLQANSPAVDAGSNTLVLNERIADLDGNYRIANGAVDIGAYEFASSPLLVGDANCDGKVDGSDVTILAGNWQAGVTGEPNATWYMGDFNGDGKVDGSDVTILAANWQAGVTSAVVATSDSDQEDSEEVTQFIPPATASLAVATVPRRESLSTRRLITPTPKATDAALTESTRSENDYTAIAKDLASVFAKKSTAASDELFALEMNPYADFE